MLTPEYLGYAKKRNAKFPLDKQLTLTFNAQEIILATPVLKYYLQCGMKITKIDYLIEYMRGSVFKPFVDKMVGMRIKVGVSKNTVYRVSVSGFF